MSEKEKFVDELEEVNGGDSDGEQLNLDLDNYLRKFPNEIWTHIFDYIPQNERVFNRIVSKFWCRQTDLFSNFSVTISDGTRPEILSRIQELRVRKCEFASLKSPFDITKFQNPALIKEIIFASKVSYENLQNILQECVEVENLRFFTTFNSDMTFKDGGDNSIIKSLKKLKDLEIGILNFKKRSSSAEKSSTFEGLIGDGNLFLPTLEKLSICFDMNYNEWISFLSFAIRHNSTGRLKSLKLHSTCLEEQLDFTSKGLDGIDEEKLNNLNFECIVLNNGHHTGHHGDNNSIWEKMLLKQNSLKKIELFQKGNLMDFVHKIITKNKSTLVSVKFYEVKMCYNIHFDEDDFAVDGSLFSEIPNLEEIVYHNSSSTLIILPSIHGGLENRIIREPSFTNFYLLPTRLKVLNLKKFQIETSEIEYLSKNLVNLEELCFYDVSAALTFDTFCDICSNLSQLKKFIFDPSIIILPEKRESGGEIFQKCIFMWDEVIRFGKTLDLYTMDNDDCHHFKFEIEQLKGFSKLLTQLNKKQYSQII